MDKEKVNMVLALRQYVIDAHNSLDGASLDSSTAIVEQRKVAQTFSSIIKSLEDVLEGHVNFS